MIEPTTTDIGRRVLHTGFFGHARAGVLKGYDSKGYAKVLFDGRHEYSYVTLKNVAWDDAPDGRCLTQGDGTCISDAQCMHSAPPMADDDDDDDDGLVAVGAILGGVVEGIASAMGSDDDDSEIKGGGGSFGGGGDTEGF